MARVSYRNKTVIQKRKAESSESDDDSLFPEEVDNATGIDLPNDNAVAEESKEEEQDADENIVQCPIKSLPLMATMALVVHPVWGVTMEKWA